MYSFNRVFEVMGTRILDFADCPYSWVYALPPSCLMLCTFNDAWHKIIQVVEALEVGHAILPDQNDYIIDEVSLTLSRETIDILRAAAYTLIRLESWTSRPVAPDTHDFLDNITAHLLVHKQILAMTMRTCKETNKQLRCLCMLATMAITSAP